MNIINEQRTIRKQKELQKQEDVVFDENGFMVVRDDLKRRKRDEEEDKEMDEEGKGAPANHYLNVKKKVKGNFMINLSGHSAPGEGVWRVVQVEQGRRRREEKRPAGTLRFYSVQPEGA